jgi:hypothetical protein
VVFGDGSGLTIVQFPSAIGVFGCPLCQFPGTAFVCTNKLWEELGKNDFTPPGPLKSPIASIKGP